MTAPPITSLAWSALLPEDTAWPPLPARPWSRRARELADTAAASDGWLAVPVPPWRSGQVTRIAAPGSVRAYVAFPSRERAILIASKDAAVLRYVAGAILSPPPGAGRAASVAMTVGLRLLRWPVAWTIAAAFRAASLVLIGRRA